MSRKCSALPGGINSPIFTAGGSQPAVIHHLGPGAFHLVEYLSIDRQRAIVEQCRALIEGDVPAYVPVVRGGGRMHVRSCASAATGTARPTPTSRRAAISMASRCRRSRRSCWCWRGTWPPRWTCRSRRISAFSITTTKTAGWGCTRTKTRASGRSRRECRSCLCRSAMPRGFCSAARDGATRSRRCAWSPATASCSAVPRGCGITASRAFCPAPHRPVSRSAAGSIWRSGNLTWQADLSYVVSAFSGAPDVSRPIDPGPCGTPWRACPTSDPCRGRSLDRPGSGRGPRGS